MCFVAARAVPKWQMVVDLCSPNSVPTVFISGIYHWEVLSAKVWGLPRCFTYIISRRRLHGLWHGYKRRLLSNWALERVKKGVASHFSRELSTDECFAVFQKAIQKNGAISSHQGLFWHVLTRFGSFILKLMRYAIQLVRRGQTVVIAHLVMRLHLLSKQRFYRRENKWFPYSRASHEELSLKHLFLLYFLQLLRHVK